VTLSLSANAGEVIKLPYQEVEGVEYRTSEKQFYSSVFQTTAVTNVSEPTLTVYRPSVDQSNGTAVIIAPGGGLFGLSINLEGADVANWLVAKGVTAFVLKYRLVPTGHDGTVEFGELFQQNPAELKRRIAQVLPGSIQDALNAVKYVRENAKILGIDPKKIGFMGFSAGGAVAMGVAYEFDETSRTNFTVAVYPWTDLFPVRNAPADAAPMMVVCATNDEMGLATGSIELYKAWYKAELSADLHLFSRGGHGFGMRTKGLPSDKWIERFYDWAIAEGFIEVTLHLDC